MKSEYDQAGLRFDPGVTRVERLGEAVVVIKSLFAGEKVTFSGRHYQVTDHTLYPRPVQRPHPPILIGGNAPRVLALAAKEADIVGLTGIMFRKGATERDVSDFRATRVDEQIRFVRDTAGERFESLELNALIQRVIVADDRRRAAEELASRWPQLTPDEILETPYALVGPLDRLVEDLIARRERWGISYYAVHEGNLDTFAPIVARLAGK
jgi:probable F420-dependent oxidoreductase